MNKIVIDRSGIRSDSLCVYINNNEIHLLASDVYFVEYMDISLINVEFIVSSSIKAILFESAFLDSINVNNKYIVNDGELRINKFYNNNSVSENIDIDLLCDNSRIDYYFSSVCRNCEEYIINVNHEARGTISNISNKSILMDGSKINFVINSKVGNEYVDSKLDQNTRIVTFGDSEAKVSPNMFIDCDKVMAKHGSVIGTFKESLVFYLMSRGIDYNEAIKLLIKGFLFSNMGIDSILREKILNVIDKYWR